MGIKNQFRKAVGNDGEPVRTKGITGELLEKTAANEKE
jgi:hypothetical protein